MKCESQMDWEWLMTLGPVARALSQVDTAILDVPARGMLQLVSRGMCRALREAEDTLRVCCSVSRQGADVLAHLTRVHPRATKLALHNFAPPLANPNSDWEHGHGLAEMHLDLLRAAPPRLDRIEVRLNPVSLLEPAVSFRRLAAACNTAVTHLELVHPESYYFRSVSLSGYDGSVHLPRLQELVVTAHNMLLLEEPPVSLPLTLNSIRWSKVWSFWQDPPNHLQLIRMAAPSLVRLEIDMNPQDLNSLLLDQGGIRMPKLEHLVVRSSTPARSFAAEIPHVNWLRTLFPCLKTLRLSNLAAPKAPLRLPECMWAGPDGDIILSAQGPPTKFHTSCLLPLDVTLNNGPIHPSSRV